MAHHDHADHGHGGHGEDDEYDVHPHITPTKTYLAVLGALLVFTGLTVLAYNVRLGDYNLFAAVAIATMKATLVVLYFMHMKYDTKLNALVFIGSLLFGGLFLAYTMNDTNTRTRGGDEYWGSQRDIGNGGFAAGTAPGLVQQGGEEMPLPELPAGAGEAPAEGEHHE